jgi:hypothetical protein
MTIEAWIRAWLLGFVVTTIVGCGGSRSPVSPSGSTPTLRGTVTDPTGDSLPSLPSLPVSPDLVSAAIEVSDGTMTLTVSFVPGTLSPTATLFYAYLDTDEDPSTGRPGVPGPGGTNDVALIGSEYWIDALDPRLSNRAQIFRTTGGTQANFGSVNVTFPNADQARIEVPLTLLGNDDGRMRFKIVCQQWLTDSATTLTIYGAMLDYMPNLGEAAGVVR